MRSRLSVTLRAAFGNQLILPLTTFLDLARTLRAPDRPCTGALRTPCARPCATVAVRVVPRKWCHNQVWVLPGHVFIGRLLLFCVLSHMQFAAHLHHFHTEHVFVGNVGCVKCPKRLQRPAVFLRCTVATILAHPAPCRRNLAQADGRS